MTQEEKAKAYDEAIEWAKKLNIDEAYASQGALIKSIFPELAENEDDKIRKAIIEAVKALSTEWLEIFGASKDEILAYLEKQKDASKAIEAVDRIDKYVKYIRAHTANAHDMNDSHPDKKYYSGVDDTLSNITGILNSAYSEEKQKGKKDYYKLYDSISKSEWFKKAHEDKPLGCGYEEKEQKSIECDPDTVNFDEGFKNGREVGFREGAESVKPVEWSENFEENIRNLLQDKLTWRSEDGSMSSTVFIDDKTLKDIINGIWFYVGKEALKYPNKELNVTEWSEEDEVRRESSMLYLSNARDCIEFNQYIGNNARESGKQEIQKDIDWLKSLRPQPRQKDRYQEGFQDGVYEGRKKALEEYNKRVAFPYGEFNHRLSCYEGGPCTNPFFDCVNCPRMGNGVVKTYTSPNTTEYQYWKPSKEQMTDLFIAAREGCEAGSPTSNTLKTLYKDLEKL